MPVLVQAKSAVSKVQNAVGNSAGLFDGNKAEEVCAEPQMKQQIMGNGCSVQICCMRSRLWQLLSNSGSCLSVNCIAVHFIIFLYVSYVHYATTVAEKLLACCSAHLLTMCFLLKI